MGIEIVILISSLILSPLLYFSQNILENCIIHLHAVVQVDGDHLVGKVVNLFLIGTDLCILCLQSNQRKGCRSILIKGELQVENPICNAKVPFCNCQATQMPAKWEKLAEFFDKSEF